MSVVLLSSVDSEGSATKEHPAITPPNKRNRRLYTWRALIIFLTLKEAKVMPPTMATNPSPCSMLITPPLFCDDNHTSNSSDS